MWPTCMELLLPPEVHPTIFYLYYTRAVKIFFKVLNDTLYVLYLYGCILCWKIN